MTALPEHARRNREMWDQQAPRYVEAGERAWASNAPVWGIFQMPETELRLLPDDLAGKDAIELGCGTAYVSSWMARRGARVVGVDNSALQLETARRLQHAHGLSFELIHCNAETIPLADASFDFAISEYGACLWADPDRWVPEVARLPLCVPDGNNGVAGTMLLRPEFGMKRVEWPGDPGVEFHLSHGDWIRVLRRAGFEIENLTALQAPKDATTPYTFVTRDWARQWPYEEVWTVRKKQESRRFSPKANSEA